MHFVASRPIILTVDDSEENLDFISGLLEDDYMVQTARSGEEALSAAHHFPRPELILLDICMPGMDGFEVCQRLKADPETSLIPVIFLTSLNQPEDEVKGLAGGAVDFITKPFKPAVVKARVRTHIELVREKQRGESLLANILPPKVIDELKNSGFSTPQLYDDVSVLFADLVNFTTLAAIIPPKTLLNELTEIFSAFDDILLQNGAQRIKTIGDAYLGVCGMPEPSQDHAVRLVRCGLEFIKFLQQRNGHGAHQWQIRIGINSGPVVAGIVGFARFQYDIFGDTVNLASRVQTASEPMHVCVSANTLQLLHGQFRVFDRGEVDLKGKGPTRLAYIS